MTLEPVLADLQIPEALTVFSPYWEASAASADQVEPLLDGETVQRNAQYCGFAPTQAAHLSDTARRIAGYHSCRQLLWHCHSLIFRHLDYDQINAWPSLAAVLGQDQGVFYLLAALGMVPLVQQKHLALGVDPAVTQATCQQVSCFASNYHRMTGGALGIPVKQLYWLRHYPAGRLFRLGRMEYMLKPFAGPVQVYRHRQAKTTVALANEGTAFNAAGYMDGTAHWTATLLHQDTAVSGFPISPQGFALSHRVRLPLAEWECVLQPGDWTLDLHIPAGGGMDLEKCRQSFVNAAAFFPRFFPEQSFASITCSSWIFNNQLQDLQLSSRNLAAFQRELYLYPVQSNGSDGLWFIFLQEDFDSQRVPRETNLQRVVAEFLEQGNVWRGGGMFFLIDDLDNFGSQTYWHQAGTIANMKEL